MRVALVHSASQHEREMLYAALRTLGVHATDVSRPAHISIHDVASTRPPKVRLGNFDLQEYDRILFNSMPYRALDPFKPTADEIFGREEREAALLAALFLERRRVFNQGEVFGSAHLLREPSHRVRQLEQLGWRTPTVRTTSRFPAEASRRERYPEPDLGTRYLLALTSQRAIVHPYGEVSFAQTEGVDDLIDRTQSFMLLRGYDWMVIPIATINHAVYAYGFSTRIPTELGLDCAAELLRDALGL